MIADHYCINHHLHSQIAFSSVKYKIVQKAGFLEIERKIIF